MNENIIDRINADPRLRRSMEISTYYFIKERITLQEKEEQFTVLATKLSFLYTFKGVAGKYEAMEKAAARNLGDWILRNKEHMPPRMWVNKNDHYLDYVRLSTRRFKGDTGYKTVCLSYPEYIRHIPGGENVFRYITLEDKERMKAPENQKVKFTVEFEVEVPSDTIVKDTLEIVKRLYSEIPEYTGKIKWRMK